MMMMKNSLHIMISLQHHPNESLNSYHEASLLQLTTRVQFHSIINMLTAYTHHDLFNITPRNLWTATIKQAYAWWA